jgi:hypothetical protein
MKQNPNTCKTCILAGKVCVDCKMKIAYQAGRARERADILAMLNDKGYLLACNLIIKRHYEEKENTDANH